MAVNIDDACKNVHLLMSATEYAQHIVLVRAFRDYASNVGLTHDCLRICHVTFGAMHGWLAFRYVYLVFLF